VGADGVAIEARHRRRFVPYAEIDRVARAEHGVIVDLRDGSRLDLPVQARILQPLPGGPEPVAGVAGGHEALHRRELLLSRIHDAIEASSGGAAVARLDVLDRKDRPVDAWRDALRALFDRMGSYRGPHLTAEQLLNVVADARVVPERRVAAAVALSASDDRELRRRVRITASACADDDLRAAIEHGAEGEIDETALERVRYRHR
jgi:hypothetical protein